MEKKYIVKIVQNFQEQKLLEKFLKESQGFSESVIRSINNALIVVDKAGKILKVTMLFTVFFKLIRKRLRGLNLSYLNHSFLSSAQLKQNIESIVKTEPLGEAASYRLWKRHSI